MATNSLTQYFSFLCRSEKIKLEPEYRFHPVRKWRFDFADVKNKIAVEIDGGVWKRGRHNHPLGFIKDQDKLNSATALGWRVFRYSTQEQIAEFPETYRKLVEDK